LNQSKNTTKRTAVPKAQQAREARKLEAAGYTKEEIARRLGCSSRHVYKLLEMVSADGESVIIEVPDFRPYRDLPADLKECLEFSADGFEKFFNRYSGFELTPLHRDWVAQAVQQDRLLVNVPPRHAKSEIFSVWFPIWLCAGAEALRMKPKDPDDYGLRNVQILLVSETDKLAKKFANKIAYQLTYNQKLIHDFGRFKPEMGDWPWRPNSGELMVDMRSRGEESGDMSLQVRGSGQQILGMEADWVIVDDPVSRAVARSEAEREKLSEWFHGDVMTRLEPRGRAIVVGQRLHMEDLYGELSKEKKILEVDEPSWAHINYRAVKNWETQEVLWPEKWTFEHLMKTYESIGEDLFEAMYQQNPLAGSRRLVRNEWVYGDGEHPGCVDYLRGAGQLPDYDEARQTVRVVSIDPSPTRYAGLIVAEVDRQSTNFNCQIIEIVRDKMSVRDMIEHLDRVIDTYAPQYFIFEQVAAQRWFLQDREMDRIRNHLQVIPHSTGKNKGDPVLGVESLAIDFEFGRIKLPYGDAEGKAMAEYLFDEARTYPQGRTDDLLMALWFIKYNYMKLVPPEFLVANRAKFHRSLPQRLQGGWGWQKKQTQPSFLPEGSSFTKIG
jgi:hypothetical protein